MVDVEQQPDLSDDPVSAFTTAEELTATQTFPSRRARLEAERSKPAKRERVIVRPTRDGRDATTVARAERAARPPRRTRAVRPARPARNEGRRWGVHAVVMLALAAFFGTAALPAYATTGEGSTVGAARTALAVQTLTGGGVTQVVARDGLDIQESPQALDSTTNSTVSPTVQALAVQLMGAVAAGRLVGSTPNHIPEIADLAEGRAVPGCGVDYRVLQAISIALDNFNQVGVSDINRRCTGQIEGAGTESAHYADGGGHALDFYLLNGSPLTGGDAKSVQLIKILDPLVPDGTGLGQIGCRSSMDLTNFKPFDDTCNHLHIDFLKSAGSALRYG
ncbi:hypothetical protein [Leifsonia sp. 21MFCrub1.1]|uniref:hypothetical protein n=1 Tax=Leifsonia sp. 21MFCrub1.1 TaxID=1798223 RepID=UPI0008929B8B|nr:hypothetical protein [Leifsonia sp. 21MFCrub1.1]SEB13364.1 hypothetical protein SAMN04515680_3568 [Leifsonia sp. 21MFCrub1.1]